MSIPNSDVRSRCIALLLAGGDGARLQDLTRTIAGFPIPKQYCRLWKQSSLLEATISRARLFVPNDRINVIINLNHIDLAHDQVAVLPESNIIVQPLNRDTGPGMLFALLHLEQTHPDAIVAVFPSDHYIDRDWAFITHVFRAANMVSSLPDKIAILGIVPDRPETGYGYILPANPIEAGARMHHGKSYHVEAFAEKPKPAEAQAIIERGGLWNTFVMVFKISRMLELLAELVPDEFKTISELRAVPFRAAPSRAAEIYRTMKPWNLSTRALARMPQHLAVLRVANVNWSDWGTRESIERTYRTLKQVPFWNVSSSIENQLTG
jgi:mannose-1-phosphate guanylyltransferase